MTAATFPKTNVGREGIGVLGIDRISGMSGLGEESGRAALGVIVNENDLISGTISLNVEGDRMAFVADPTELRTIDIDRGLELLTNGGASDGNRRFKIVRTDGAEVSFSTSWFPDQERQWRLDHPSTTNPTVHFVDPWRGQFRDQTRQETDQVIREALTAFKDIHGLPANSEVVVRFSRINDRC